MLRKLYKTSSCLFLYYSHKVCLLKSSIFNRSRVDNKKKISQNTWYNPSHSYSRLYIGGNKQEAFKNKCSKRYFVCQCMYQKVNKHKCYLPTNNIIPRKNEIYSATGIDSKFV